MSKLFFFLFIISQTSLAEEVITMARSPRALLMGDAYTAIADDDFTLFYNPAILARHSGFSFYPINPSFTVSNILNEPERFND